MLSWEYPPMRVGGIAAALEGLAPALARQGIEVHVVTSGSSGGEADEQQEPNLFVHRVQVEQPSNDFIHWVHLLNGQMERRADELIAAWKKEPKRKQVPILLHAHDWLGLFAGRALKYRHRLPFIATIHATEFGRNSGIYTEMQRYINQCEWELQWESWRTIVCSGFMKGEVEYALGTPWDKIDIIPNGVYTSTFDFPFEAGEREAFRSRFALPNEKIVFFIGRMVREKGAHILVDAFRRVLDQYGDAKLVIAGGGGRDHLERQAGYLGLGGKALFTGRVSDYDRDRLYRVADVAVYPSLYEPFGIVALEAMAARVPVVVSNAGGLAEVVQHDITGTVTYNGNPDSLAWGIVRVLRDPGFAYHMAWEAHEKCRTVFNWDVIAAQTRGVYDRVQTEFKDSDFAKGL
jgi:glycogen synthase